ncbi:MAG: hypothetical protein M3Y35_08065, partial [Actinomycetota bacterium]|nr:hypothetical protein [Actinomycetota bacterium]
MSVSYPSTNAPLDDNPSEEADPHSGGGGHRDSSEAPLTLTETAPRSLGMLDQFGLWGNLGVSLT